MGDSYGVEWVDSPPIKQSYYFQRILENVSNSTEIMLEEGGR